jgi:hypothetical protein
LSPPEDPLAGAGPPEGLDEATHPAAKPKATPSAVTPAIAAIAEGPGVNEGNENTGG